jgi:hypothetical protein
MLVRQMHLQAPEPHGQSPRNTCMGWQCLSWDQAAAQNQWDSHELHRRAVTRHRASHMTTLHVLLGGGGSLSEGHTPAQCVCIWNRPKTIRMDPWSKEGAEVRQNIECSIRGIYFHTIYLPQPLHHIVLQHRGTANNIIFRPPEPAVDHRQVQRLAENIWVATLSRALLSTDAATDKPCASRWGMEIGHAG